MRFLVDECTGPAVAAWLRSQGHIVLLRVKIDESTTKVEAIQRLMQSHAGQLEDRYVVVTEDRIRFGRE